MTEEVAELSSLADKSTTIPAGGLPPLQSPPFLLQSQVLLLPQALAQQRGQIRSSWKPLLELWALLKLRESVLGGLFAALSRRHVCKA